MKEKSYHSRYLSGLGWFGVLTGIPTFFTWIGGKLGYQELPVFFLSLFLVWVGSIEFRLKDLGGKINGRKK